MQCWSVWWRVRVAVACAKRSLNVLSACQLLLSAKNDKLPRNDSTNSQQKVSGLNSVSIYAMKAGKRRQSWFVVKCDRKWQ